MTEVFREKSYQQNKREIKFHDIYSIWIYAQFISFFLFKKLFFARFCHFEIFWEQKICWWLLLRCFGFVARRIRDAILHWENYISISLHIEWDMIVVTVFEFHLVDQIQFHLVQNLKENCRIKSYRIQFERKLRYSFLSVVTQGV